jgi:serine/threonine-protein kinase RsbW
MTDSSKHSGGTDYGVAAARIEVTIPADPAGLPLLRSIAAALAVALDFDIDTMADLRMAVDELGATVVTRARAGSPVTCRFLAEGDVVTVTASAPAAGDEPLDQGSFGWMVLTTLAESVTGTVRTVDGLGPEVELFLQVRPLRASQ